MPHVNFLEPKKFSFKQFNLQQLRQLELNYLWVVVSVSALVLLLVIYGLVQRHRIGKLGEEVAIVQAEVKRLAGGTVKPTGPAQKASIVDSLYQRVVWAPVLDTMASATPDTVWLRSAKGSLSTRMLELHGVAVDMSAVSKYEQELSQKMVFRKVMVMSSVEEEGVNKKKQLKFVLNSWLK